MDPQAQLGGVIFLTARFPSFYLPFRLSMAPPQTGQAGAFFTELFDWFFGWFTTFSVNVFFALLASTSPKEAIFSLYPTDSGATGKAWVGFRAENFNLIGDITRIQFGEDCLNVLN